MKVGWFFYKVEINSYSIGYILLAYSMSALLLLRMHIDASTPLLLHSFNFVFNSRENKM